MDLDFLPREVYKVFLEAYIEHITPCFLAFGDSTPIIPDQPLNSSYLGAMAAYETTVLSALGSWVEAQQEEFLEEDLDLAEQELLAKYDLLIPRAKFLLTKSAFTGVPRLSQFPTPIPLFCERFHSEVVASFAVHKEKLPAAFLMVSLLDNG